MHSCAIISGSIPDPVFFREPESDEVISTPFGQTRLFLYEGFVFVPRHSDVSGVYVLPHAVNHQAHLAALKDRGITSVVAICSTGSLKEHLSPGSIIIPDDFISLADPPTIFAHTMKHTTPNLSPRLRRELKTAADEAAIPVTDGGVYWQTRGPRFETGAEIRMMSTFADIVGMTMASEATIAAEFGLDYAALCSVDNYGNGLVDTPLAMDDIIACARANAEKIFTIIKNYLERINE